MLQTNSKYCTEMLIVPQKKKKQIKNSHTKFVLLSVTYLILKNIWIKYKVTKLKRISHS